MTYINFFFPSIFRGAQVDVRNKKGNSSLWLAANGGHLDVVQLLHSAGADIDSQDNRKVSCLMAAFRKGHSKVVKWMVKHVSQFPSDTELTRYIATISGTTYRTRANINRGLYFFKSPFWIVFFLRAGCIWERAIL